MNDRKFFLTRRAALKVGGAAALTPVLPSLPAWAQSDYPSRTISFICAFPGGSGADVLVRYFAEKLNQRVDVPVIVENKTGAASNIAAQYTANAAPDGYTLFVHAGNAMAGNMHIFRNPPVDVLTDLETIATINRQAFMITVRADSPHQTLDDLTAFLREQGDAATYAVNATSGMVLAAAYTDYIGADPVQITYGSSAESLSDMVNGVVDFGCHDPVFTLAQIREGRWRALGIGAGERIAGAPDIPTMVEQGYPIDQIGWWGVMVPVGMPDDIKQTVNGWFNEILEEEETQQFLMDQGGEVFISTPEESQALMERSVEEWEELVRIANIPQI